MTLSRARTLAIVGTLALAVGGCGGGSAASSASAAAGTSAASSGWKATDACAILDRAAVAATLGAPVKTAALGAIKAEGNGFPLYSQCEFTLEDGRLLVFGTGQSTNSMTLPEQVADMRRQASFVADSKPADLPGLGKAAFWAKELGAVYTFLGDGRYMSASVSQPDFRKKQDPIEKTQADDIAILRQAGA